MRRGFNPRLSKKEECFWWPKDSKQREWRNGVPRKSQSPIKMLHPKVITFITSCITNKSSRLGIIPLLEWLKENSKPAPIPNYWKIQRYKGTNPTTTTPPSACEDSKYMPLKPPNSLPKKTSRGMQMIMAPPHTKCPPKSAPSFQF